MKKVLPSLFLLLAFLVLPAADMTYDSLPVKVVLFPFREAILSTQIDGVVVKYNANQRYTTDAVSAAASVSKRAMCS